MIACIVSEAIIPPMSLVEICAHCVTCWIDLHMRLLIIMVSLMPNREEGNFSLRKFCTSWCDDPNGLRTVIKWFQMSVILGLRMVVNTI